VEVGAVEVVLVVVDVDVVEKTPKVVVDEDVDVEVVEVVGIVDIVVRTAVVGTVEVGIKFSVVKLVEASVWADSDLISAVVFSWLAPTTFVSAGGDSSETGSLWN